MSGTKFNLYLGRGVFLPANETVMSAFRSATITINESAPSDFSLTFQAARSKSMNDFELLLVPYLQVFNRVGISVDVGGFPIMLMDGMITEQNFQPGQGNKPDTITVSGKDVTIAMDLIEKNVPYPCMADFEIVAAILLEYLMYGLIPTTMPTVFSASQLPSEITVQQSETDFAMIQRLANKNGYIFKLIPGPVPGTNTCYFGPPSRMGIPCPTLNCAPLPDCNVESIQFRYDGLQASLYGGMVLDVEDNNPVPVPVMSVPVVLPPFSAMQALLVNVPYVKFGISTDDQLDPLQAIAKLTGQANRQSNEVVTATGSVDSERYGGIIISPGIINVRGAGRMYDGTYYVKSIVHKITPDKHTQDFTLTREGTMTLIPMVPP